LSWVASSRDSMPLIVPACIRSDAIAHRKGPPQPDEIATIASPRRRVVDQRVNFGQLCADVHALGRLVEDQDARIGRQPSARPSLIPRSAATSEETDEV
jgi:hypothetical protein